MVWDAKDLRQEKEKNPNGPIRLVIPAKVPPGTASVAGIQKPNSFDGFPLRTRLAGRKPSPCGESILLLRIEGVSPSFFELRGQDGLATQGRDALATNDDLDEAATQ